MKWIFLAIGFGLFGHNLSQAQGVEPVSWSWDIVTGEDGIVQISFTAVIEEGWWLYSQHIDDEGPIPTSFNFDESQEYKLHGITTESGRKSKDGFDEMFQMEILKYADAVIFTQEVSGEPGTEVTGYLEFMCCDDTSCLPPQTIDFSLTIP